MLVRATRPPGAIPSTTEYETIALAWSRAWTHRHAIPAITSNSVVWSSGRKMAQEKEEKMEDKDVQVLELLKKEEEWT